MAIRIAWVDDVQCSGYCWLILILASSFAAGCERDQIRISQVSTQDAVKMTPDQDAVRRFDHILETLWDKDEIVRTTGMKSLAEFHKDVRNLNLQVGLSALRAAARPYPYEKPELDRVSGELVAVAITRPLPIYVPVVMELFDKFSDSAKRYAQIILTELESREAAEAFMTIVRTHSPTGRLPGLITSRLMKNPRYPDVFFPELLAYASDPKLSFDIYHLCLTYCEAGILPPSKLATFTDSVLDSYDKLADKLRPAQQDQGIDWMWEDAYQESRHNAALLLDLLGHFPGIHVANVLREGLKYSDPRLKHFAVVSLLRQGETIDINYLEEIARHAEMRNLLFDTLNQLGKSSLFPDNYHTQQAFAEANMVNWLVFPTELGRVPDEIELMKVVAVDTGLTDGIFDYYLFRFRTKEPHWSAKDGWMAGVSGPYRRSDQPTTEALGDTFSTFTKWNEMTPDEHVGDMRELMEQWREYHSNPEK